MVENNRDDVGKQQLKIDLRLLSLSQGFLYIGHLTSLILACVLNVWDQFVVMFKDLCISECV